MCSWICQNPKIVIPSDKQPRVPSILDIQNALVEMQDKPESFSASKQWIGSFEVSLCLDYFYDIPGKIIHVACGSNMIKVLPDLYDHFQTVGAPIMMGKIVIEIFILHIISHQAVGQFDLVIPVFINVTCGLFCIKRSYKKIVIKNGNTILACKIMTKRVYNLSRY